MKIYIYTFLASLLFLTHSLSANTWNGSVDDSWNNASNWDSGVVPNGISSTAEFTAVGAPTVNIDTESVTVGKVTFNSAAGYTISGPETLTMDNGSAQARIIISDGSHTIAANLVATNSFTMDTSFANPLTFNGTISGATVTYNSGLFYLNNANTNSNTRIGIDATVQANDHQALKGHPIVYGNLVYSPGLPFSVSLVGLSVTGTVDINDNTLSLHDGNITGSIINTTPGGNLIKIAGHVLHLAGTNTYSGTTTINDGVINVPGSIISNTQVNPGAFLTGTGTVAAVANFGTVSPGEAIGDTPNTTIGTLTVNGTYNQDSTGNLLIQVSDDGSSDRLNVIGIGNATLDGTLTLEPEPGIYPAGSRFTFMNYATRLGALTLIDDSGLAFSTHYFGTFALLINDLAGAILPVPKRLLSGNSREVADYLFCRGFIPSNYDLLKVMGALVRVPADQFAKDLVKLSPAQFGALPLMNLHSNRIIADVIVENTEKFDWCDPCVSQNNSQEDCQANRNDTSVWVAPVGYYYDQDGIQGQVGFDSYAVGVGAGASHLFFNSFHVGGGAGYTYSKIDWDKDRGDGHINSVYLGPSLGWSPKNGFLNLLVMGSYNYYDIDRKIKFPGVNRTATNKHHSYDVLARLDGGYRFRINIKGNLDHIYILPEARVSYLNIFEQRYTESGADSINLTVDSKYSALLQPNLLIKFLRDFHTNTWCIMPAFQVGWISNIWLSSGNYKSRFYKQETCQPHFVVKSFTRNTNQLSLGLDINFRHDSDWIIDVGCRVDFLDDNYVVDGKVKVEKRF
ncbi:MAG: autotransporter domain-containing protein [Simkaniaceae bacterium]|nr:MAG: autotransporter domain-containing protein [Simkaniaceae bacterium]